MRNILKTFADKAIVRYCASDKRFVKDDFRPYQAYYSIVVEGKIRGFLAHKFDEWVLCLGDIHSIENLTKICSVRQLKKLLK